MIPGTAVIKSDKSSYDYSKKICGLYPLERNIIILIKAGFKKIHLDLSEEEKSFYSSSVAKHIKNIGNKKVTIGVKKTAVAGQHLVVPSNMFMQSHYFNDESKYFIKKGKIFTPSNRKDQFLLKSNTSFEKGVKLVREYIIKNTGGFIAQKINKRISIPISLLLARTRIHPNYLTFVNMIIGISASVCLLFNSYWLTVLGGFLFQTASVMDGVDGEVAKFTFKVSKIGGWLDTIGDNLTLILFITVLSYLYFVNTGGYLPVIVIVIIFAGIIIMLSAMVRYLKKYSKSGSLVAYDREYLQKLPGNDPFIFISHKLKYITKKEFFSIIFFVVCLTGKAYLFVPVIALVLFFASVILTAINFKYLNKSGEKYFKKSFTA